MERDDIENYIEQLKNFEKMLSSDETDFSFMNKLDDLLGNIQKDVEVQVQPNNGLEIKIKKLYPNAVIPTYSKDGDAGMDLTINNIVNQTDDNVTYGFGIALEIPMGYMGLIFPRSSVRKTNLILSNSVGVIDSGYRGEIQATFKIKKDTDFKIYEIGERGAQIIIMPYPKVTFIEASELSDTERGEGGFGSTGN